MARFVIPGATEVLVGPLPDELLPPRPGRTSVAVFGQPGAAHVTAQVVDRLAGRGLEVHTTTLPDRDGAKEYPVVAEAWRWLADGAIGRGDTIVGVGGGALTDAVGFIAATWLRGVESVYVPTTLLGAVDASIGGKTGINVVGKNLVGAFAHPARVLIDPSSFEGLPAEVYAEGLAEALKAGYLADQDLVALLRADGASADPTEVVERAVAVKVDVVAEDFTEQGRRAILNYGHTLGHGIELVAGISHGEAIAVGMVAAAVVSSTITGFDAVEEHRTTIAGLGLPTSAPAGLDVEAVLDLVGHDKKRTAEGIRMVLLEGYGAPVLRTVAEGDLRVGLAAVGIG